MTLYFAKSTGGFYDSAISPRWPSDALEITADRHAALFVAQASGHVIQADADGNPVAVAPPVPTRGIPQSVTPFQARVAMHGMASPRNGGKTVLDDVTALMAASSDPVARLAWEYATTFERSSPTLAALAPAIGLTAADLDALFTAAGAITA